MFYWEMIAVAIGGALGAVARFLLSRFVQGIALLQNFPLGIFICNALGCLLIGIFYGILSHRAALGPITRAAMMIGFLGGFTTFSSFSLDTVHLLQSGEILTATANIALSVIVCLLLTAIGMWFSTV